MTTSLRRPFFLPVCAAALALATAAALTPKGAFFTSKPHDRYGYQTDAYLSGQLRLKIAPPPALLALPDPYAGLDSLLDVSLFNGRYYFYYGVAPIVTLFAPVRLLTGRWPTEGLACVVFALLGAVAALTFLSDVRRRYAPDAPWMTQVALVLSVVLANGVLCWIAETGLNQLAQISGWCWLTMMIATAWHARHSSRQRLWFALASVAFGLAVASRPSLVVAGVGLLALAWRRPAALAVVLPAAVIGAGLAWLNWARFGSPWEFGSRFALSGWDTRSYSFFSLGYLPDNLRAYLGNFPIPSARFPFLLLGWRQPIGLIVLPFCWLACGAMRALGELRVLVRGLELVVLATTLPLLFFFCNWSRMEMDFLPTWTLLGSIGLIVVSAGASDRARRRFGWLGLAAVTVQTMAVSSVFFQTLTGC